jgi:hypothetical protein
MATYTGGCHCGRIRFEVEGNLESDPVTLCNCSICSRTAYLHWPVEPERLRLLTPSGNWTSYRFLTRAADHRFCPVCGVSPFRVARSDPDKITVNARCLEGVDVDALHVVRFDGRNWEAAFAAERGAAGDPAGRSAGAPPGGAAGGPASGRR